MHAGAWVHRSSVAAAALVLGGAVVYVCLLDQNSVTVDAARDQATAAGQALDIDVPPIADLQAYVGHPHNDADWVERNPFVPWHIQQARERQLIDQGHIAPPPQPQPGPATVDMINPPEIVFQPCQPEPAIRVLGVLMAGSTQFVRLQTARGQLSLQIGDQVAGWSLQGVDGDAVQVRDPAGRIHRCPMPANQGVHMPKASDSKRAPRHGQRKQKPYTGYRA